MACTRASTGLPDDICGGLCAAESARYDSTTRSLVFFALCKGMVFPVQVPLPCTNQPGALAITHAPGAR
jgi:hypothetical protein